ncbi:pyocin activator PrtN family protein [Shewanella sp. MBTL60-007]|uniref:pyocin activator PrtN family protein n=1 Tax=Shewanella sp. MBTL60-007 TaxID=2815911 RepID=UPI001BBA259A|nr:pyocin activator PrtN family protein [Shewanella sp. MBTL60-007]GIU22115.1 hypothetical protein TUM3792_23800 [Shewanella sp. MBTL60-007]
MNTTFLLMAQFNKAVIPLEDICKEFLGLETRTALNYAKSGRLPIAAFRTSNSNKAPWVVHVSDLADHLDKQRDIAKQDLICAA